MNKPTLPPEEPKTWRAGTLVYTSGGLVVLFLWLLLGDFVWSMRDRSIWPMVQWYLHHLQIPNWVFGLLLSFIPGLIILVVGPIVSVRSDRHRSPRGRRLPFLIVTAPVVALGMIGIGLTPMIAKAFHGWIAAEAVSVSLQDSLGHLPGGAGLISLLQNEIVIALVLFTFFWLAFELGTITSQTVFSGLINDVVPKQLLGRFHGLFRAVSLIDGMIFNYWIIGHVPVYFSVILITIGTLYGIVLIFMCLRVKEGEYPPPTPAVQSEGPLAKRAGGVRTYLRECFSNSYYVSVFALLTAGIMALAPVNTFSVPYALSLGVDMGSYGKTVALTYLISLGVSFFVGWLADLFHPIRMAIATLAATLVITTLGSLFATTAASFLTIFLAYGVITGSYLTSVASLGQRLFPQAKFAQFASAAGVFTALGNMMIGPSMGAVVDWQGGDYRCTFITAAAIAGIALILALLVQRKFMALGGPRGYVAPQ